MALDIESSSVQMQRLMRQSAAAAHAALLLTRYRKELDAAWSGEDRQSMDPVINDLILKCEKLCADAGAVGRDIFQAMEDILAEEARAESG